MSCTLKFPWCVIPGQGAAAAGNGDSFYTHTVFENIFLILLLSGPFRPSRVCNPVMMPAYVGLTAEAASDK